jgi:hypothetical protein
LKLAIRRSMKERVCLAVTAILVLMRCEVKLLNGNLVKLTEVSRGCFQRCKPMFKLYSTKF